MNPPARLTIGDWLVRPLEGFLERAGERRHLRPKSMDVLVLLASRPSTTVPRDDFFREVWDGQFIEEASLARCITEIRAALDDDARNPRYIETVPRRGYRLIAPVGDGGAGVIQTPVERPSRTPETAQRGRSRRPRATLSALFVAAAAAVSLGWWLLGRAGGPDPEPTPRAEAPTPAVAILGVRKLSGGPDNDWLQPALEQMLATELSASTLGRAVPADVSLRTARELSIAPSELGDRETLRRLGSALGATYLVTGSYLTATGSDAETLRIDLLVQDGASGEVIEGIVETGSIEDLSTLVLSAGQRLRGLLGFGEGPANRAPSGSAGLPTRPDAARLYFQAILRLRRDEPESARDLLLEAVGIEPTAPFVHLALADAWTSLGYDSRAAASAAKSLELCPSLPAETRLWSEAHAYSLTSNWPTAIERLAALRLLAPDNLEYGLALADAQTHAGDASAALEILADLGHRTSFQGTRARIALTEARAAAGVGDHTLSADAARRARTAAERVNAPLVQGDAFELEALALYKLGQVRAAELALARAMELFDDAGQRRRVASARLIAARWLCHQGKLEEALPIADYAIEIFRTTGDRKSEAAALLLVGDGRWRQGAAEEGEAALQRSIELNREINDRQAEADSLRALAIARASYGRGKVVDPLEAALAIYREIGKLDGVAATLINLGRIAMSAGDTQIAIERYNEAERIFRDLKIPAGRASTLFNLGHAYFQTAEVAHSISTFREAARIFTELDNDRMLAASLDGLAMALIASGKLDEARRQVSRCRELRTGLGESIRIVLGELGEADLHLAEGNPQLALRVAERARDRARDAGSPQRLRDTVEAAIAEIQLELGRPDLARAAFYRLEDPGSPAALTVSSCNLRLLEARILAGLHDAAGARRRVAEVEAFAASHGLERFRLEAELLRLEFATSGPVSRSEVADLEGELRRRGLVRLAERARRLLRADSTGTAR